MLRFEFKLAWRHLVSGGGQTLLTVCAVAIAVTGIIFIQTLITACLLYPSDAADEKKGVDLGGGGGGKKTTHSTY